MLGGLVALEALLSRVDIALDIRPAGTGALARRPITAPGQLGSAAGLGYLLAPGLSCPDGALYPLRSMSGGRLRGFSAEISLSAETFTRYSRFIFRLRKSFHTNGPAANRPADDGKALGPLRHRASFKSHASRRRTRRAGTLRFQGYDKAT